MGGFFVLLDGVFFGVINGLLVGIFFGFGMALFSLYQTKKHSSKKPELDDDIIDEGPANHRGVGGWLFLTKEKLFFQSHAVNFGRHELSIPLSEIVDLKGAKSLGLIPNQLHIHVKNGEIERFVLNQWNLWKQEIEEQITSLND